MSPRPIMATTKGTRMRRPIVIRFGRFDWHARPSLESNRHAQCRNGIGGLRASSRRLGLASPVPAAYRPVLTGEAAMTEKPSPNGMTYADAGVDIDAGNAMVDAIRPLVRATRAARGGRRDRRLRRAVRPEGRGLQGPLLVAANDGVGTKVMLAIETGRHETIGIDLVAMSVNDLVVQGAEPLFFLDYFATGNSRRTSARRWSKGIAAGCLEAGCALIGGETAEMPGLYARATTTSRASRWARPNAAPCCRAAMSGPGTSCSACPPPASTPTASRSSAASSRPAG